jgi:REP element-mobilizing transposase RayT
MPFIRVWLHIVWSTKNREPYLKNEVREVLFEHMRKNAKEKNIYVDRINGSIDHVHCLVSLGSDQTIAKVVQMLKGEASHWINSQNILKEQFEWQDAYFSVSVSESNVETVRRYIDNQEEHHQKKSFAEEYQEFQKIYQFG